MAVPPDSQDRLRRIESRLIGLRKNADSYKVPYVFVTDLNHALDELEAMGISTDEFRPADTSAVGHYGLDGDLVLIDGPYFRSKLDAAIHYLSGKRA
jgi:hypothetical protein